jgi:lauroyl/myristoyl acyltransferase
VRLLFYQWLVCMSRLLGPWFFRLVAGVVACGYFLLLPGRTRHSVRFYRVLFPRRSSAAHIFGALRQYINFTTLYLDRLLPEEHAARRFSSRGWKHIDQALAGGHGVVILMSHMGNWESAVWQMRSSLAPGTPLLLYMGQRDSEQIEGLQKRELGQRDIRVVAAQNGRTDALDVLEGLRVLARGGVVSMTGDRLWSGRERCVRVRMLGHFIRLPQMPYRLAMAARAPIIVFFSFRDERGGYRVTASPPIRLRRETERPRRAIVLEGAQRYADLLEAALREYPFQWYHFGPFLDAD